MTRVLQPSFAGGEVSPSLYGRVDLAKYQVGLKRAKNLFVHPHGGVSNRAGTEFIAEIKDSSAGARLIQFQFNTTQTYVLEFGNQYMRVIKDGAQVLDTAKNITGITQANPGVFTSAGHGLANGKEVYLAGIGGMVELNSRNAIIANATTNTFTLTDLYGVAINTTSLTAYTSGGTVSPIYEISTPYAIADVSSLKFTQSADVMWLVHPSYPIRRLSRTGDAAWALSLESFGTSVAAPTSLGATSSGMPGTANTFAYVVTAVDDDTGEESLASANASIVGNSPASWPAAAYINLAWTGSASRYRIYKDDSGSGSYGFIGTAVNTSFRDANVTPDVSNAPQITTRNPFGSAGNYPSAVAFYQQRLVYGATNNAPSTVWASQTASFKNFNYSTPNKATDAIQFTAVSRSVNRIRSLVPMAQLILLTSGAEFVADAGANSDAITPSSLRVRPQGYRGSNNLDALVIGNTILFMQEKGSVIRDFGYEFASDAYTGNNLVVLAYHLFQNYTLSSWAYAQAPDSIVWVVRNDGVLLSLTYMKEHDVFAWSWHQTEGLFEDVVSVSEGQEDVPYFIVKRIINGQTKRYIERLHSRTFSTVEDAFFVDSGLTYSGSLATIISGLWHLEGESVVALADGNVVKDLTITNGAVTLPNAATKTHIGKAYTSELRTLSIDFQTQQGTAQGRLKRVGKAVIRVKDSRGIWMGPSEDKLTEFKQRSTEAWDAAMSLYTGDINQPFDAHWSRDGDMWIKQFDPLPMTIEFISPEIAGGN